MPLTVMSQIHFDQVDRRFGGQRHEHVGVSSAEIVDLLGSVYPLGIWRLEIETGRMFWSEDAFRIHNMDQCQSPVSLNQVLACYHPEDAKLVEQLMETATTQKNSYRHVMRVQNGRGGFRLVASAGRYRADNGGELIGYYHEFQDMVRSVVLAET